MGPILRPPDGALYVRTLQGSSHTHFVRYTRSIGPIGGLGDPYGPITRVRWPEGTDQKGGPEGPSFRAHMDPKGDPYMGPKRSLIKDSLNA